ncbi:hypothetical protein JKP88DRAFT_133750, partial [Tribonema minus]
REAFEALDDAGGGSSIAAARFPELFEQLGTTYNEEAHTKTLQRLQDGGGRVPRDAFMEWYVEWLLGGDDDASSDGESEEAEREEERAKVREAFAALDDATSGSSIAAAQFPELFEQLGTTYNEEAHTKTLLRLQDGSGRVPRDAFMEWYVEWLLGGDDDASSDGGSTTAGDTGGSSGGAAAAAGAGFGDMFKAAAGEWKCEACLVRNAPGAAKCASCETPAAGGKAAAAAGAASGAGAARTASAAGSGIGPSGFSFGAPVSAAAGFSFG